MIFTHHIWGRADKKLEKLILNISRKVEAGSRYEDYEPILEAICHAYNPGWLLLAKWHMEQQDSEGYDRAKDELKKFLENDPTRAEAFKAWRLLGKVYFYTHDDVDEVHAFIESVKVGEVSFYDLSNTANKLNRVLKSFKEQGEGLEEEQKYYMANELATVLRKRKDEANGTDFSRMAWLEWHLGREDHAQKYVKSGLKIDPSNVHLQNLAERFGNASKVE